MTQMIETVAIMTLAEKDPATCPFKDKTGKKNKTESNYAEDEEDADVNEEDSNSTVNCSGDLADNLGKPASSKFPKNDVHYTRFKSEGPHLNTGKDRGNCGVIPNAHHLIPGHAALPRSKVCEYMGETDEMPEKSKKKFKSQIKKGAGGIDYDVNAEANGVWLPSNNILRGKWSGKTYQCEYAFLTINRAKLQFHDAHPDYSDFCIKLLNAIAAAIKNHVDHCKGEDGCESKKEGKKFTCPPYPFLKGKINAVAGRLRNYLALGNLKNWQPKVVTSRFNIFYKEIKEEIKEWKKKTASRLATIKAGDKAGRVNNYAVEVVETSEGKTVREIQ